MARIYGSTKLEVKSTELPVAVMLAVGRLVRAVAEMEDILDLFIGSLAQLSESRTTIMLGRTAISKKLEIALDLAKTRDDAALGHFKAAFDQTFLDIIECRNVVAHGKLLGETKEGFAFLTTNPGPVREDSKIRIVVSYAGKTIEALAALAEIRVPEMEAFLQVADQRAERLLRPLLPHSKAQLQGKRSPPSPPQSSEG